MQFSIHSWTLCSFHNGFNSNFLHLPKKCSVKITHRIVITRFRMRVWLSHFFNDNYPFISHHTTQKRIILFYIFDKIYSSDAYPRIWNSLANIKIPRVLTCWQLWFKLYRDRYYEVMNPEAMTFIVAMAVLFYLCEYNEKTVSFKLWLSECWLWAFKMINRWSFNVCCVWADEISIDILVFHWNEQLIVHNSMEKMRRIWDF